MLILALGGRMAGATDPYAELGVERTDGNSKVTAAYRARLKRLHPDTGRVHQDRIYDVVSAFRAVKADRERREGQFEIDDATGVGAVPSRSWGQAWKKGATTPEDFFRAGLSPYARRPADRDLVDAILLADRYERKLHPDFRWAALDTRTPFLYRALYLFDAATLFDPPRPGEESQLIANILRTLRQMDGSLHRGMIPDGQYAFSELFMAGFLMRMSQCAAIEVQPTFRHPLCWRLQDQAFRDSSGMISSRTRGLFRTPGSFAPAPFQFAVDFGADGSFRVRSRPNAQKAVTVDFRNRHSSLFFWQVAETDLEAWENFIGSGFRDFLAHALEETNGRAFLEWANFPRTLEEILAVGKSRSQSGPIADSRRPTGRCRLPLGGK